MSLKKLRKKRNERTGIFLVSAPLNSFLLNTIFLLPCRLLSSTLSGCTLALWQGPPEKMDFQKQNFQNIFEDNIKNYYDYCHLKSVMGAQTVETNEVFPITNALCVKTKENNNEYHFVLRNSKSFCRERRNNDWLLLIKETLMLFSRSLTHLLFKTLYKGMASSWDGLVLVMHDCPHSWLLLRRIEMHWDGLRWTEMDWDGLIPVMYDCPHSYLSLLILSENILTAIPAEQVLKYCTQVLCFDSLIVAPVPESPDTSPSKAGSKGIKMNTRNVSPALWACNSNSIMELLLGFFF